MMRAKVFVSDIRRTGAGRSLPKQRFFPTCYGHEFQAKFHWHVEYFGTRHAYIKRGAPQLNGKVERSHQSDGQEFYQLLSYKGDVDLKAKLGEGERFYNFHRPHCAHNGKTPYEALREKL